MRTLFFLTVLVSVWVSVVCAAAFAEEAQKEVSVKPWGVLLDSVREDARLEAARTRLIESARESLGQPLVCRVYTLEDVGKHRTWLDDRSGALEDEIRETFALAMSDFAACNTLATELPVLAAAYRLTKEEGFRERVNAQLAEMAAWSPLQRPGWTLYSPGHRLPADGKDGNWLATGCGVRAITTTLDLMPEGSVPDELRARLAALLQAEVAGVVDDWNTKRPWFVRGNNAVTNQWVLPTEGLVCACLALGVDKHDKAYELGVANLLHALDAHGSAGEFEEGIGYASFTVTSMLYAAHAMAATGDRRALEHPFLARFPTWLVHHFQPGNMAINCFDAGGAYGGSGSRRPLLSLLAVCAGSPVARWALAEQTAGPSDDLPGLVAQALPPVPADSAPPLFAAYERATRVNWRDNWSDDGTGVWLRGGHPLDQHDHQDRGHVNFISRGRPIFIEAGTPSYGHKLMMTHYTTGVGHNVLQLGTAFPDSQAAAGELFHMPGWQTAGGVAPIGVETLDGAGGRATIDATACYDDVAKWNRTVAWTANEFSVDDEVELTPGKSNVVLFRWHLGTEKPVTIEGTAESWVVTWPDAVITLNGSAPLAVSQVELPDHTLRGHDGTESPTNIHACLVVQTTEACERFLLHTKTKPQPPAGE